jgi:hypothetical protein
MARRRGSMSLSRSAIDQSVAALITESQCGSGDFADAVSVLDLEGGVPPSRSSCSCCREAMGAAGVVAPDESGNMERAPFG